MTEEMDALALKQQQLENWIEREKTLIALVQPASTTRALSFGEARGVIDWVSRNGDRVESVLWNEDCLSLATKDGKIVRFRPELLPDVAQFFERAQSRYDRQDWSLVWGG